METNFFFVDIQRRRLAPKVQPEGRGQVFGELEAVFGSESTL